MIETITSIINQINGLIEAVKASAPNIVLAYFAISGACAGTAAAWKKPENIGLASKLHAAVNVIGWNIGHAVNKQ